MHDYFAGVLAEQARQSWIDLLGKAAPDSFFTVTFARKQRFPRQALEKILPLLPEYFTLAFLGAEEHFLGGWHLHGLGKVYWFDKAPDITRSALYSTLGQFGKFRRVEPIHHTGGVQAYVSKYLTKELADYDFVGEGWRDLTVGDIIKP